MLHADHSLKCYQTINTKCSNAGENRCIPVTLQQSTHKERYELGTADRPHKDSHGCATSETTGKAASVHIEPAESTAVQYQARPKMTHITTGTRTCDVENNRNPKNRPMLAQY